MTLRMSVNADTLHLVLLPLAPPILTLLHFSFQVTSPSLPSMPGPPAKTNSSADAASRRGQYYIPGADLVIRVRDFLLEYYVVALSKTES